MHAFVDEFVHERERAYFARGFVELDESDIEEMILDNDV
jgi:hypothetical protein